MSKQQIEPDPTAADASAEAYVSPTTRSTRSRSLQINESAGDPSSMHMLNHTPPRPPSAAATASAGSRAAAPTPSSSSGSKKRPYRRTKRPVNYCDKSTVTTTTAPLTADKFNAFDIVLKESQDLLQAASEAQQLGRLKMSSTYLLLLHARLVGLGKRFDKAELDTSEEFHDLQDTNDSQRAPDSPPSLRTNAESTASQDPDLDMTKYLSPAAKRSRLNPSDANEDGSSTAVMFTPKTRAAKQLASMLPSNIEMDQAMMEHLAKAAAQLHAARSGKLRRQQMYTGQNSNTPGNSSDAWKPGDSISAAEADSGGSDVLVSDAREFLAQTSNEQGMVTARDVDTSSSWRNEPPQGAASFSINRAVSFTVQEYQMLHTAAHKAHETKKTLDIQKLAKQTGRPEDQIRRFVNSLNTKTRLAQELELDEAMGIVKRGRGRKPATTAINTVPEFHCNARDLMKGGVLMAPPNEGEDDEAATGACAAEGNGVAPDNNSNHKEGEGGDDTDGSGTGPANHAEAMVAEATNQVLI